MQPCGPSCSLPRQRQDGEKLAQHILRAGPKPIQCLTPPLKHARTANNGTRRIATVTIILARCLVTFRAGILTRLREAEVDAARRRVGPARGDDLPTRVEVDPFGAVDVRVAEQRRLPATEREVRDRYRDWHFN